VIVENTDSRSVRGLQEMLRNISYYVEDVLGVIPDGNFNEDTKNSVVSFQRAYGLEPTGEVNAETWGRIRDVSNQVDIVYAQPILFPVFGKRVLINPGDEMAELYVVQAMLYSIFLVFPNAPQVDITGVHNENSVEAVVFVQEITGLEPTGVIDTLTYNQIAHLYTTHVAKKL